MLVPSVCYLPEALPDANARLARLIAEIEWDGRMRARRTASFGVPYNYSGQVYPAALMPPVVAEVAARAAELAGHHFDNCLCNLYETGDNTMGFHRDSYDGLEPNSQIAIASFGAARALVFRASGDSRRVTYLLEHGSILLMGRGVQQAWAHSVPRSPGAGLRISLTFRLFARAL